MRQKVLATIIRAQIRKELQKVIKRIDIVQGQTVNNQYNAVTANAEDALQQQIQQILIPAMSTLFKLRLMSGAVPAKISSGLRLFIDTCVASFGETVDDLIVVPAKEITLPTFTEDRWVYVYLKSDGEYTANKYPPQIGDNTTRIPICRVWMEHDATDFDPALIRDIRVVGIASANINHALRQIFLNLFKAIPSVITSDVQILGYTESGLVDLKVQIITEHDNGLYASLCPLPDAKVIIPRPGTGVVSQDYYLVARAIMDTDNPDDLEFEYIVKPIEDDILEYEIPLAIIRGVDNLITQITNDMIEVWGIQNKKEDYYTYSLDFSDNVRPSGNDGYIQFNEYRQFQADSNFWWNNIGKILVVGGALNKTEISANGIELFGGAVKFGMLSCPAIQLREYGGSVPSFNGESYAFDKDTQESLYLSLELPKDYKPGTDIYPYIIFYGDTLVSGDSPDVLWEFDYRWTNIGDVRGSSISSTELGTISVPNTHVKVIFSSISGSGKTEGSHIWAKISRLSANTSDNYPYDAYLISCGFLYSINKLGTTLP
jgi:hypothetical protein